MYKFLNLEQMFEEEVTINNLSITEREKIKTGNILTLTNIKNNIAQGKHEKALRIFINNGKYITRGQELYEILSKINKSKIKNNELILILEAQLITNKYYIKDYDYIIKNTETFLNKYKNLLKFKYPCIAARISIYYIESLKELAQIENAQIKIEEFLNADMSAFAKGALLLAKYEIEGDILLLERAHDLFLQVGAFSNAIQALYLYANKVALYNRKILNRVEKQLEFLVNKSQNIPDFIFLATYYYGLIIKYKDMKEYEIASDYAFKCLKTMLNTNIDFAKDLLHRTVGVISELSDLMEIPIEELSAKHNCSITRENTESIAKNNANVVNTASLKDKNAHWDVIEAFFVNKDFSRIAELEKKYKDDKMDLSIVYLRYAEYNTSLSAFERIRYLEKAKELTKNFIYFDQQRAHIFKVYCNIFSEIQDNKRYLKYAKEYLKLVVYDVDFNDTYIKLLRENGFWKELEEFCYLYSEQVDNTPVNDTLLIEALYNQNKELNKVLTLIHKNRDVEFPPDVKQILRAIELDLLERNCQIDYQLLSTNQNIIVTLNNFEKALDDYIQYVEANLRKDYSKYSKEEKRYKWISEPEKKCKKDLKMFLDLTFKDKVEIIEEVSIGAGFIDLYVKFNNNLEIIIELKMCGQNYTTNYAKSGIEQVKHYLKNKQTKLGYLLVYDARTEKYGTEIPSNIFNAGCTIFTKFIDMRMNIKNN